jgi:hypothetical protein
MRRMLLLATVAVMMVVMMAAAGPSSATIHRLSCGDEKANEAHSSNTAQNANPPGITDGDGHDTAPQSNPALIVDEDANADGGLTPEDNKDAVGEDGGPGGHANADKPGCNPPGQVE